MIGKPCNKCLEARRKAKAMLAKATGSYAATQVYRTNRGTLAVDSAGFAVECGQAINHLIGAKVYVSGKSVYRVDGKVPERVTDLRVLARDK